MTQTRKCGECRECCIVLEVEPLAKPADKPCQHLCTKGCAIYEERPQSCRIFDCAWRQGALGPHDKPSRNHCVIWSTAMTTRSGERLHIIQCNIRSGFRMNHKVERYLRNASYSYPVLIVQDAWGYLWSHGKTVGRWHQDDFVLLDFEGNRITDVTVKPKSEVLTSPEAEAEWQQILLSNVEVEETDPEYRKVQKRYVEDRA